MLPPVSGPRTAGQLPRPAIDDPGCDYRPDDRGNLTTLARAMNPPTIRVVADDESLGVTTGYTAYAVLLADPADPTSAVEAEVLSGKKPTARDATVIALAYALQPHRLAVRANFVLVNDHRGNTVRQIRVYPRAG